MGNCAGYCNGCNDDPYANKFDNNQARNSHSNGDYQDPYMVQRMTYEIEQMHRGANFGNGYLVPQKRGQNVLEQEDEYGRI